VTNSIVLNDNGATDDGPEGNINRKKSAIIVDLHERLSSWWEDTVLMVTKEERRRFNGLVIYTCWNLWKERNRRILSNVYEPALQVASRIKEDIAQRKRAIERAG